MKADELPRERLPTGIPGLDTVLDGGLLRRAVYMVRGKPGGGKTILANQICFHHAAHGGRVTYVTLLAETHERMFFNLEQLAFFDPSMIPDALTYVSGFHALEDTGLKGLTDMLRREARARRASLLVVDGLVAAQESAGSAQEFKKFVHDLQIQATLLGCTVLLVTSATGKEPISAEHTMVDGVIEILEDRSLSRSDRELEVLKFRGSGYLRGQHAFVIDKSGLTVFPRFEGMYRDPPSPDPATDERVSTGIASLDATLRGGLPSASSTALFGPTGSGKTTMGLHFLSRASADAPAMHFGFYETPERVLLKSDALGLGLKESAKRGHLHLLWNPPTERMLDALGHKLLGAVRDHGVKRLFVDGMDGFMKQAARPERLSAFFSALTNQLRTLGVTTLFTAELPGLFTSEVGIPINGISSLVENVVLLRFFEHRGSRLVRSCVIVKLRDSDYDKSIRELVIAEGGASLGPIIGNAGGAGTVRTRTTSPEAKSRGGTAKKKKAQKAIPKSRRAARGRTS